MTTGRYIDRLDLKAAAAAAGTGILALLLMLGLAGRSAAAEPHWPSGPYKYIAIDQSVSDALVELGRNMGMPIRVSAEVKGRLGAGMPQSSARAFFEAICSRYGLVWYFDGIVMNVATEAEIRTEILPLSANAVAGAQDRLSRLGVLDPRFPVTISRQDEAVSVSGPPSYIALVKQTLGQAAAPQPKQQSAKVTSVRVFRGGKQAEVVDVPSGMFD